MFLGYDVQSASVEDGVLYIAGAPRYNHTGRVLIYTLNGTDIKIIQILNGEQVRMPKKQPVSPIYMFMHTKAA